MSKLSSRTSLRNSNKKIAVYSSLREAYQKNRCAGSLNENYKQKVLLREQQEALQAAVLILEANQDGKKAAAALKKFNAIKVAAEADKTHLQPLVDAVSEAANDVKNFMGESGFGALFKMGLRALSKKFGIEDADTNPLLKSLTLLNCLETGFGSLEDTVSTIIPDYNISDASIAAQAGISDTDLAAAAKRSGIKVEETDDLKNVKKMLIKSFKPEPGGTFAKIMSLFETKGGPPYLEDLTEFVNGLVFVDGKILQNLVSSVGSEESKSPEIQALVKSMTQQASGGKEEIVPQKVSSPQPVANIEQVALAAAAGKSEEKNEDPTAAIAAAQKNPKAAAKEIVDDIVSKTKLPANTVSKILTALIRAGKLKSEFRVTSESRSRNIGTLSVHDALRARNLYLESGGSSRKWIRLLVEADVRDPLDVAEEMFSSIKGDEEKMKVFTAELATRLGLEREEIQRSFEKDQGEQELAKIIDKHAGAVEKAAEKAGVDMPKDAGKGEEKSSSKWSNLINDLEKIIGDDIKPQEISAVLDALPGYFIAENLHKKRRLLGSKKNSIH